MGVACGGDCFVVVVWDKASFCSQESLEFTVSSQVASNWCLSCLSLQHVAIAGVTYHILQLQWSRTSPSKPHHHRNQFALSFRIPNPTKFNKKRKTKQDLNHSFPHSFFRFSALLVFNRTVCSVGDPCCGFFSFCLLAAQPPRQDRDGYRSLSWQMYLEQSQVYQGLSFLPEN